jgi:hypothetical protein
VCEQPLADLSENEKTDYQVLIDCYHEKTYAKMPQHGNEWGWLRVTKLTPPLCAALDFVLDRTAYDVEAFEVLCELAGDEDWHDIEQPKKRTLAYLIRANHEWFCEGYDQWHHEAFDDID